MALTEVQIAIPIAGGVDTKSDAKRVPPTKLRALENGVFAKSGAIAKRTGYDDLGQGIDGGDAYENPRSLATRDGELLLFADDELLSYRESTDTWSRVGHAESIVATESPLARTGTVQLDPDAATLDGVTVVAWEDSRGGVWWSVVETGTGRILRPAEQLDADGQRVRALAVGSVLHLYYAVPADGRIWCTIVNPSAYLDTVTPVILIDDLSTTNPSFDACVTTRDGEPAVFAWARNGGGYRVGYVDTSGVLGSPVTGHPSAATWLDTITGPIAVTWDPTAADADGTVATLWNNALVSSYRIHNADSLTTELQTGALTWAPSTAPVRCTAVWKLGEGDSGGRDLWLWSEEPSGGADRDNRVWAAFVNSGGSIGGDDETEPLRGHGLVSRAFSDNAGAYVIVAHDVPFFPYAAVVRYSMGVEVSTPERVAVGRLLTGVSAGLPTRGHLPSVEIDESDERIQRWLGSYREQVNADPVGTIANPATPQFTETALKLITLDFDHPDAFRSAQLGRDLVIAGALPLRYDGDTVAELNFHSAPDGTIGTAESAGGSLTDDATYLYAFSYEETDAQGEIHAGPMSIGTLVQLGVGENRVTLTIPTYRLTSKRNVRIAVWRSEADDTDAEDPTFFRVSSLDPSDDTGSNRYVANDATVDTVTFVDDLSDAELLLRERSYLDGGIISNDPPPLGALVAGGKNRLFFSDPSDSLRVRFTQERRDGYAPEPAADLATVIDPYGGPVVGIAVLDDKVIAFKESAIYFFAGPGPLANPDHPNSQGFSPPTLVTSDVGCTSAPSIGVTPLGVVFQSGKGIYLLDRGLQVRYIGAPVEAYNAQRITGAALLADRTQVLFLAETGKALLYDYFHDQWSTFSNHTGPAGVTVDGVYHYLRTDGRVFRENTDVFLDGTASYTLSYETAWIKLVDYLQGWQWFYYLSLIGTYKGAHTLKLYTRLDYEAGWGQPFVLNVDDDYNPSAYGTGAYGAGVYGGSLDDVDTRYQKQVHLGEPGEAISVRVEDFESTAPLGDSFELQELLFTGGIIGPKVLLGPSRRS